MTEDDEPETPAQRLALNIGIVVFVALLIGAAIWLGNSMLGARKADQCMSAGARNCTPVDVSR